MADCNNPPYKTFQTLQVLQTNSSIVQSSFYRRNFRQLIIKLVTYSQHLEFNFKPEILMKVLDLSQYFKLEFRDHAI